MNEHTDGVSGKRAAFYIRMSTEHQQYSTENQAKELHKYAARRGHLIVATYADEGKSGLSLQGRTGLKKLIADVQSGDVDFETILVYDISRWGRFQDADESAYYEYICKRAGITIEYCAEQFENDGSTQATIIKSVKRAMAGEYSRELSVKVFQGQCTLIEKGFRQGGAAGYGLRRMLIDHNGDEKGLLKPGERKSLQTDRVILVAGPAEEITVVERIYNWFVHEGLTEREIAERLNAEGIAFEGKRSWSRGVVHEILTNEKYIGNNVRNRTSYKLKKRRVTNPPEMWVRRDAAFDQLVSPDLFYMARGMIRERCRRFTNEQMLELLKSLFSKQGHVSGILIDETEGMPSSTVYRSRFGSLIRAYTLIGFNPGHDFRFLEINRTLRAMHPEIVTNTIRELEERGAVVEQDQSSDLLLVNDEYTATIVLARCRKTRAGAYRWRIRFDQLYRPDITIVVRMNSVNSAALDYYLFPRIDLPKWDVRLGEFNGATLDTYRFDTLEYFWQLARRASIEVAA